MINYTLIKSICIIPPKDHQADFSYLGEKITVYLNKTGRITWLCNLKNDYYFISVKLDEDNFTQIIARKNLDGSFLYLNTAFVDLLRPILLY